MSNRNTLQYAVEHVHGSFRQYRVRKEYKLLHPDANTNDNPQFTYHIKQNCTATTMHISIKENNCNNTHHCKKQRVGRQNQDEDMKTREKSTKKCSHENNSYVSTKTKE
jgi:hypothetical protein